MVAPPDGYVWVGLALTLSIWERAHHGWRSAPLVTGNEHAASGDHANDADDERDEGECSVAVGNLGAVSERRTGVSDRTLGSGAAFGAVRYLLGGALRLPTASHAMAIGCCLSDDWLVALSPRNYLLSAVDHRMTVM